VSLFAAFRRGRGLSAIAGPVLRPADPGYTAELAAFNTAFRLHPGMVVGATSEADVTAAVAMAAADSLPLATKGTGHGVTAEIAAPVLVSTRRLDAVTVDARARTARVGAGATWTQVVSAAAPHGLAPLCASSTSVGVAGYTLGGGMSPFGRRYGFAADHLRRLRLVTADGRAHEIDEDRAPELFWAVRGAGKNGFGVVTEMEFALFPISRFHGGGILLPGSAAPDLLHTWREWAPTLPDEASTSVAIVRMPSNPALPATLRGRTVVHLRYVHLGRPAQAEELLAPLRAIAPPLRDGIRERSCTEIDAVHDDPTEPGAIHERGAALRELPAAAVDAFLAAAGATGDRAADDSPVSMAELRWMGGAFARPAPVPNVVAGRDAACSLYVHGVLDGRSDAVSDAVDRLVDAMAPWSLGGALPNFAGPEVPGALWSPRDRARLRLLQRAVDPEGMFASAALP
jgi:FAD/FMN-containing dehydrogenase